MKRILIPTDFSENAKDAFKYALRFVRDEEAIIQVFHVVKPVMVDTPDNAMINARATEIVTEQAKSNLELLTRISDSDPDIASNVTLKINVAIGAAVDEIISEADRFKADLIVMGTQGRSHSGFSKFIGTVSSKIISTASCPVLLIPKDYKYKTIDNVIFTTKLDTGDPYELNRSLQLIAPHNPVVQVVYVKSSLENGNENQIGAFAKYMVDHSPAIQTKFCTEPNRDIEEVINRYAVQHDAELIIMHRSKKRLFDKFFKKSHTKEMAFRSYTPLLILN